jgi:hypothetical protein
MSTNLITQAPELRPFYVASSPQRQARRKALSQIPVVYEGSNIEVAKRGKSVDGLMNKIETFFSKPEHMGKLLPFLKGESKISIRLIEWFVSIYCSQNTVDWFFGEGEYFNVHLDYQAMMGNGATGGYTKQLFDPFCRKWRKEKRKDREGKSYTVKIYHGIKFYYTDDEFEITTVAQLNFFKWFISNKVLDYMIENKDELTAEMNLYNHEKKRRKREAAARKEQVPDPTEENEDEVTVLPVVSSSSNRKVRVQAMKRVTKRNVEVYVSFD